MVAVDDEDLSVADMDSAENFTVNLDALADRQTIAAWLGRSDPLITAERIRQWAKRGRIARHGKDTRGRTLYRIGDVMAARHARYQRLPPATMGECDTLARRIVVP